jgi:hypothetical protein
MVSFTDFRRLTLLLEMTQSIKVELGAQVPHLSYMSEKLTPSNISGCLFNLLICSIMTATKSTLYLRLYPVKSTPFQPPSPYQPMSVTQSPGPTCYYESTGSILSTQISFPANIENSLCLLRLILFNEDTSTDPPPCALLLSLDLTFPIDEAHLSEPLCYTTNSENNKRL